MSTLITDNINFLLYFLFQRYSRKNIKNNNKENIKKYELLNIAILLKLC